MIFSNYEPHIMNNPLLPFIFHWETLVKESIYANWHTNIEIILCISGSGRISCDAEVFDFNKGDIFVFNSNKIHSISTDTTIEYYCLIIDKDFCLDNGINSEEISFKDFIQSKSLADTYMAVARAIANESNYSEASAALNIRCSILRLLLELNESYLIKDGHTKAAKSVSAERSKEAIRYICKNISSPLTLDDIAAHCGVSKCYLSREFKKNTGQNIFEYINIIRCKEAKKLILKGMSASAAAISCGFENMSYFSRTYKRYIGTLPSKTI